MRILLVNYRYFISGGPEKYMFNIKKMLEDNGHEVIPFSIHSNKNVETEYSQYFVEPIGSRDATYFEECKKTPKVIWQMLTRSIYSTEVEKAIKKEIKDVKPDLVYIIHFVNKLSPSVICGAKKMGIPVVLRLSDYFLLCPRFDFMYNKKPCEECLTKGYRTCIKKRCVKGSLFASAVRVFSMKVHKAMNLYKGVDAFITPSEFLKKKLIENGFDENKITCIPTFTASKSEVGKPQVGTYGLYFGRVTEEKGVDTVVKAYEMMPDRHVKIMGDDTTDEAKRLKAYIKEKKIKNVEFLGFKTGEELEEIIKGARFTLIPSIWYDNLPNTALESFQYSKPVIASNIGSLPELVLDGVNGYLFKPADVRELCERVALLDNNDVVEKMGGMETELPKNALPHWELAKKYDLIDFDLGVKITGAGFPVYKGQGARLQRALINFFLDEARDAGYLEIMPPTVVNSASGYGTGQLPDKEGQMYHCEVDDLYLIPTAEVPVTNIYRDVILDEKQLPIKNCAYTQCFRREAGSYGKDVRGLNRLHEFSKVELVRIDKPEHSKQSHQEMLNHVEGLLQKLELPYRILRLCGGDMSFTAALCFDFEVYSEAQQRWLEVSSVSNFDTYQANRLKCRYRDENKKTQLCHTLNGSALALPRIVAALLENNQTPEGIRIPKALIPYTGFDMIK